MTTMKLSNVQGSATVYVRDVLTGGALGMRLREMGFLPGTAVKRAYRTMGGAIDVYSVMGAQVALRRTEASCIEVSTMKEEAIFEKCQSASSVGPTPSTDKPVAASVSPACTLCQALTKKSSRCGCGSRGPIAPAEAGELTIAIVGNPNCGKTAFFNAASGGHEHTGNYAGVTVQSIVGHLTVKGRRVRLIDLPGTYSLHAYSPDEAYVMHCLATDGVDAVINVVNAAAPERHFLLTQQLQRMGKPTVVALNMMDELEASGGSVDLDALQRALRMPCTACVATAHKGVLAAVEAAVALVEEKRNSCSAPPEEIFEKSAALAAFCFSQKENKQRSLTARLDHLLARGPLAYLAFALVMWLTFYLTFTLGQCPMDWIDALIGALSEWLGEVMPEGWLSSLLIDGVLGGVGSVIVFLPNILILYVCISALEDSGYLSRAALLADPLLSRVGLHGKSFVPLLMGFGCNVPAIMATRTIEQRKARLITMLTAPLMSCSARLPVYVVFAGAFFPENAAEVMLALYVLGIVLAILVAALTNACYKADVRSSFVMEMPPYRRPRLVAVAHHAWEKGRQYLHKMGTIILTASLAIWALGYFPRTANEAMSEAEAQEQSYLGQLGHAVQPVLAPLGFDWKMSVGVISGLGAKELMVGTLGVIYQCEADDAEVETVDDASTTRLAATLRAATTPAAALSYMVFALLYFPCMATIAAVKGESGRWRTALFTAGYTTLLAYVVAFVVYNVFK